MMRDDGWERAIDPLGDTYRYQVFDAGKIVHIGITMDLETARDACKQKWPHGRFIQVGEKTSEATAKDWLTRFEEPP
jgi:hypothetical protein